MVNVDENWLAGAGGEVGQGDRGGTQKGRSYKLLGRVAECHTIYSLHRPLPTFYARM